MCGVVECIVECDCMCVVVWWCVRVFCVCVWWLDVCLYCMDVLKSVFMYGVEDVFFIGVMVCLG